MAIPLLRAYPGQCGVPFPLPLGEGVGSGQAAAPASHANAVSPALSTTTGFTAIMADSCEYGNFCRLQCYTA